MLSAGPNRCHPSRGFCRLLPPGGPGIRLLVFLGRCALDRGFHPFARCRSACRAFRGCRRHSSCRTGGTISPSAASGRACRRPADGIAPRVGVPAVVKVVGMDIHGTEAARAVSARTLQCVTPSTAAETTASSKVAARGPDRPACASAKASLSFAVGGSQIAFSFAATGDIGSRPAHAGGNGGLPGGPIPAGSLCCSTFRAVSHAARGNGFCLLFLRCGRLPRCFPLCIGTESRSRSEERRVGKEC